MLCIIDIHDFSRTVNLLPLPETGQCLTRRRLRFQVTLFCHTDNVNYIVLPDSTGFRLLDLFPQGPDSEQSRQKRLPSRTALCQWSPSPCACLCSMFQTSSSSQERGDQGVGRPHIAGHHPNHGHAPRVQSFHS